MSPKAGVEVTPGAVVEFFDARVITLGVCLAVKSQRLTILSINNREVNLASSRVLHATESMMDTGRLSRDDMVRKLQEIDQRRRDIMDLVDIQELWSLLEGQEEGFSAGECAEFIFSDPPTGDHVAATQRCLLNDRLFFQHKDGVFFPRSQEKIDQKNEEMRREAEKLARIEESAAWLQGLWSRRTRPTGIDETHRDLVEDLKQFCLYGQEAASYSFLKDVFKKADIPPLQQSAFRLLVRLGVWREDENLYLHEMGISDAFSEELQKQAQDLNKAISLDSVSTMGRRLDLRYLHTITIDSAHTQDLDDALSIRRLDDGTFEVGIHIADAAHYISKGDPLDEEARNRATSIYLPDARIPMLPLSLSEGICSLQKGVDRLAMSFLMRLDEEGTLVSHEIHPSIIHIKERLTYQEVNERIEEEPLQWLHRLALVQRDQRIAGGAVNLPLPEIQVRVLPSGMIQLSRHEKETPSQLMVSEWMITANGAAASYLANLGIPSIYRGQAECKPERDFVHSDHEIFHIYRQRRLFSRAELDTRPQAHCSLGMPRYTTATSPIRRYADLVVQRQLKAALEQEDSLYGEDELKQLIMQLGIVQSKVAVMQRKWTRYWMLKYLEQEDIQSFNALVLDLNGRFAHLLLPDYLMEANLPIQEGMELQRGAMIKVNVDRLNPREDILRLQL